MNSFDMRRPSKPDYDDALRVTVRRRSVIERILGAWWLLRGGSQLPVKEGRPHE